jgi:hypothetical protein
LHTWPRSGRARLCRAGRIGSAGASSGLALPRRQAIHGPLLFFAFVEPKPRAEIRKRSNGDVLLIGPRFTGLFNPARVSTLAPGSRFVSETAA